MYTPPAFRQDDPAAIAAFLDAHPFATLVTVGEGGLSATPLPLLRTADGGPHGTLIGHLARANPQWRNFDAAMPALAIFAGPHAYITPSWYPSKAETGRVVPTWNYIAVHCHGRLELVDDAAGKLDIVTRLTSQHEAGRPASWSVTDAPADYIAAQLKGIVGIRLVVDRVEAKWKLSQNRRADDRAGVREGLLTDGNPGDRAVAEAMMDSLEPRQC